MQRGIAQFGGVVRRDRGRHAHRDALRAVGQQVRKPTGQDRRLFRLAVIVGAKLDRVLIDALEQEARDLGHPGFGVAVGGGVIAVDVAEIALPVHQRITRREILRQPHQRVIDRLVAVRMEAAHHVADDLGGLLEGRAGIEPQQPHAVEDAAVNRLQAIAGVREGPVHDSRQCIREVALLERFAQSDVLDVRRLGWNQSLSHGMGLTAAPSMNKARIFIGRPCSGPNCHNSVFSPYYGTVSARFDDSRLVSSPARTGALAGPLGS